MARWQQSGRPTRTRGREREDGGDGVLWHALTKDDEREREEGRFGIGRTLQVMQWGVGDGPRACVAPCGQQRPSHSACGWHMREAHDQCQNRGEATLMSGP
jgi:hypothetical protein